MRLKCKHTYNFLLLLLTMAVAVSCAKEPDVPESKKIAFDISMRGLLNANAANPDNAITSIRIMAFYAGGKLAEQIFVHVEEADPPVSVQMKLDVGYYNFVFIANEDSDETGLTQVLDGYAAAGKTLTNLQREVFASSAFRNDYSIPMTKLVRNVTVTYDSQIKVEGIPVSSPWEIDVERVGVRVDLIMQTTFESMKNGFSQLQIAHVPEEAYFFNKDGSNQPLYNVTGSGSFESTVPVYDYRKFSSNQGDQYQPLPDPGEDGANYTITAVDEGQEFVKSGETWYWYKRLILPESLFASIGSEALGVQLQAVIHGKTYYLTLSNQAETDFTVARNSRYLITGTLEPNYIEFSVKVTPWGTNTNVDIPLN